MSTSEAFYGTLLNFYLLLREDLVAAAQAAGLNFTQALIVLALRGDEGRQMGDLHGVLSCDPSNVTGIVDGLEHRGLARRYENPRDRRGRMVVLEPEGEQIRKKFLAALQEQFAHRYSKLSPDEQRMLGRLMQGVLAKPGQVNF